jgi:hypothetical protein
LELRALLGVSKSLNAECTKNCAKHAKIQL